MEEVVTPVETPVESPIETVATPVASVETPVAPAEPVATPAQVVDAEIQELFKVVSDKIRLSVANQQFTPDSFQTILLKVVETVEELSANKATKLTGTEKRAIATNITRLVIDDLHAHGQINDETYGWMSLGLTFLAPVVFQGAKLLWNKLQDVVADVEEHGASGCCRRNFFRRK